MIVKQVISVVLRNQADALIRLTGLCYRKGVAIESLSYATAPQMDEVRFRAVLLCEKPAADQLYRHIANLIGVVAAEVTPYNEGGIYP